jgi:PAS domain S-box-containing protein
VNPFWGTNFPYIFYFPATVFIALFAGAVPAFLGIAITSTLTLAWILPPTGSLEIRDLVDVVGLCVYVAVDGLIAWIGTMYRDQLIESERQTAELESSEERIASDLKAMMLLHDIGTYCVAEGNVLENCLENILDAAIALTAADKGNIQLFDPVSGVLRIAAYRGFEEAFLKFFETVDSRSGSACGAAMNRAVRVVVEDIAASPMFAGQASLAVLLDAGVRAVQSTPLKSSSGQILGMISTHFANPRKPSERELRLIDLLARQAADYVEHKRAEEALRLKENELRAITEITPVMLTRCSRDLRYLYVNRAYAAMLGSPPEEIIGKSIVEVMGKNGLEVIWPRLEQVLAGQPVEYEDHIHFRLTGSLHYLHVIYMPERDAQGRVVGWVASLEDVTERKRAEEALREGDRRKDEFLAMLGHELRNPVGIISNGVKLLQRLGPLDAAVQEVGEMIQRQVTYTARMLDDLLDVSRITRGKIELIKEICDMSRIVRETISDYRKSFDEKAIRIDAEIPRNPVWVMGDKTRLAQAFGNILSNALKFTEANGRVRVKLQTGGDKVAILRVKDTGIGIEPEMIGRVFEMFAQADRSLDRNRGGLGLGLPIVKGIVELHGGKVSVSSDGAGKGAEFTIRLPMEEPKQARSYIPELERDSGAKFRILVVEDNPVAARSTKRLLEESGHTVEVADNGMQALELGRCFRPDVILCDIGLPNLDGYGVCRAMRKQLDRDRSFFVGVSGYAKDERRALEARIDAYLTKPIDFDRLEELLASFARQRSGVGTVAARTATAQ